MTPLLLATHEAYGHRGWFPFPFFPLVFIGLWVVGSLTIGRRWRHGDHRSGQSVLAERFARGEIDEAEYRERRTVLQHKS